MFKKKVTIYALFLILIFFNACVPKRKLDNGQGNGVPKKGYFWKNQSDFESDIYQQIDPNFFYELVDEYWSDKNFNRIKEDNSETLWKKKLQFYPNGKLRRFASKLANPNPDVTGNRGIIYKNKNSLYIDIFEGAPGSSGFITTYKVKVEGNNLYMIESTATNFIRNDFRCTVFKKSDSVTNEYKSYKADW